MCIVDIQHNTALINLLIEQLWIEPCLWSQEQATWITESLQFKYFPLKNVDE
jgi:hypothetical protein